MRALNRLAAKAVQAAKPGKYADGGGLWLIKRKDGGGQWVYRFDLNGKRREMGLGSARMVSLKDARKQAEASRSFVANGRDPIRERDAERRRDRQAKPILEEVAKACFEARQASLKDGGRAGGWFDPLRIHVLSKLGKMPIEDIQQNDIRDTIHSIWNTKPDTAKKALNRLSIVIRHAAAMGLNIDLQVTDKAKALLGAQKKHTKHIPAMPWTEVPEFYHSLQNGGIVESSLALVILTACRSGEARSAKWSEVNLDAGLWIIPGERMKAGKEHRVPLSGPAIQLLDRLAPLSRDDLVFPAQRKGCVSDMAMGMLMRRRGIEYRPHGFRSSFRDWCAEKTDVPREVAEACLAHATGSQVERAYRRTDFLERRRELMDAWGGYVSGN